MCRELRWRNHCVAIVAICLCFCGSRGSEKTDSRKRRYVHSSYEFQEISPRIMGGEIAPPHAYPFQVNLLTPKFNHSSSCGGSLISPDKVLTAAHCLDHQPLIVVLYLGTYRGLVQEPGKSVTMTSKEYLVHRLWDRASAQNDIALVHLPEKVTFSEYIQPVSLASGGDTYAGKRATIIGWGHTEKGSPSASAFLRRVNVTIISNSECKRSENILHQKIVPVHLCTSGTGLVGACFGDSGGPLVVDGVQVGIVSFGVADCEPGPSVFTRVSEFKDWITAETTKTKYSYTASQGNTFREQLETVLIVLGSLYFLS